MKVRNAWGIGAAVVLAWGVVASQAATFIPYAQSFETAFPPTHWSASGGGTVAATAAALLPGGGVQGLSLSNDTVTLDIDDGTYTYANTWIQIYAKPVVGSSDPSSVSGQTGAFYLKSNGDLRACTNATGNNWVTVASGLPTTTYLGFIVHADYGTSRWEIYYSTGASQTNKMQLANLVNGGSLHFATPASELDNVSVSSGDKAYLDQVAVSRGFTTAGAAGDRVATFEHSATATNLQDFTLAVYASAYTNPVGNNALGVRLGNDILSGLVNSDRISVWDAGTGRFQSYPVVGNAIDNLSSPGNIPKNNMYVYSNTRMQIDLQEGRGQTFGFYPYSNSTVVAVAGVAQGSASGQQETVTLNGTTVNTTGFTALNWIDNDTLATIEIRDPDAVLLAGDRMYLAPPTQPNSFKEFWWDDAGNWRDFNDGVASANVTPGSKIWVKRNTGANEPITVTH